MTTQTSTHPLGGEDRRLIDLVASALVDPNLHTDQRMRLSLEIEELLRGAHEHALATTEQHLPKVLEAVLTDPSVPTDVRMRLTRDVERILSSTS